jgi:hypothetical protein
MVIFRMSSSSFVQYLPSASSRVALFRSPRIERSDHPAWPPRGFRGPWFGKKEQRFPGKLRDYRCITHDNRTYVIEPRDGRPLRRSTNGKGKAAHQEAFLPGTVGPGAGFHASAGPGTKENFQNGRFCREQGIGPSIMLDGALFGLSVPSVLSDAAARHSLTKKNFSQKSS